jgi:hypothetical protein
MEVYPFLHQRFYLHLTHKSNKILQQVVMLLLHHTQVTLQFQEQALSDTRHLNIKYSE